MTFMVNAFPAMQISTVDLSANPQENVVARIGGIGLTCPSGVMLQDVTLPANTANLAPAFPAGVTTAVFVYVSALTTTDLIVKVGGAPVSLSVPANQGLMLYGIASSAITLNSVKGGKVQYAIGG